MFLSYESGLLDAELYHFNKEEFPIMIATDLAFTQKSNLRVVPTEPC